MSRLFMLGDEWLYLKLYLGKESFDRLLLSKVLPLGDKLSLSKTISEFFFIRYEDSFGPHLRVRFHLSTPSSIGLVITELNLCFKSLLEIRLIKHIVFDSYTRELERYGQRNYPLTESVFCIDSICQLRLLKIIKNYRDENLRWKIGLVLVDDLLSIYNIKGERYVSFVEQHRDAYRQEYQCVQKQIRQKHNDHYRKHKAEIEEAMNRRFPSDIIAILNERKESISFLYDKMIWDSTDKFIESYWASIIHMTINRFFEDSARICEMALYEFLFKYKRSEIMRNHFRQ